MTARDHKQEGTMDCLPTRHACPEWDFLEIDETDPEFDLCPCYRITPWIREAITRLRNRWLNAEHNLNGATLRACKPTCPTCAPGGHDHADHVAND